VVFIKPYEGKNINHLGLEFPTIAGALFDKNPLEKVLNLEILKELLLDGLDSGYRKY
jgi:hypothetical protein